MPLDQLIPHLTQHAHASGLAPLSFRSSSHFHWHYPSRTVYYDPHDAQATAYLLHEYGHALLGHCGYARDVQLVAMERAAWNAGCRVGTGWQVTVDDELIESSLDTYRDWLHAHTATQLAYSAAMAHIPVLPASPTGVPTAPLPASSGVML